MMKKMMLGIELLWRFTTATIVLTLCTLALMFMWNQIELSKQQMVLNSEQLKTNTEQQELIASLQARLKAYELKDKEMLAEKRAEELRIAKAEHARLVHKQRVDKIARYIMDSNFRIYPALANMYANYLINSCEETGIPVDAYLALIKIESHFNYRTKSGEDCLGLSQVNPRVWIKNPKHDVCLIEMGVIKTVGDLLKPEQSFKAGAVVFRYYYEEGKRRNWKDPLKYALVRYVGTSVNYMKANPALKDHRYYQLWLEQMSVINDMGIS